MTHAPLWEDLVALGWVCGASVLYLRATRPRQAPRHRKSTVAEAIKALETELRPWEPWEPPGDPELDRALALAKHDRLREELKDLPQRVQAKRVLFLGTPGPESREWLFRPNPHDMRCVCTTCEDQHRRAQEEGA